MNYDFKCVKCGVTIEKDIPLAEYDRQKDSQVCFCGGEMKRVLEWKGIATGSGEGWHGARGGNVI